MMNKKVKVLFFIELSFIPSYDGYSTTMTKFISSLSNSDNYEPVVIHCDHGISNTREILKQPFKTYFVNSYGKERCTPLDCIDTKLEKILRDIVPSNDILHEMKLYIKNDTKAFLKEKKSKQESLEIKINQLENKERELSQMFIESTLLSNVFIDTNEQIQHQIEEAKRELWYISDSDKYIEASNKTLQFLSNLENIGKDLDNLSWEAKSSRVYSMELTMVSNCIIKGRNVSSYLLNKPFEYFRVLRFDGWQDL